MEVGNLPKGIATFILVSCLCCGGIVAQENSSSSSSTLTLAVFISAINDTGSFTGGSDVGRPFIEAVDLAVDLINEDPNFIPGYTLEVRYSDSQVCIDS